MIRGFNSCTFSQPNPRRSSTPGPKFSSITSQDRTSRVKTSLPWAFFRFTVMERLLQFSMVK